MARGARRSPLRWAPAFACALVAGCGDDPRPPDPAAAVRRAAADYLAAVRDGRWEDACARMTASARAAVGETGGACADALARGDALPDEVLGRAVRQLPGAKVAMTGSRATVGPVGALPAPLRLTRAGGHWLIDR